MFLYLAEKHARALLNITPNLNTNMQLKVLKRTDAQTSAV